MTGPENGISLLAGKARPNSCGSIRLTGPNPDDPLLIDPATLAAPKTSPYWCPLCNCAARCTAPGRCAGTDSKSNTQGRRCGPRPRWPTTCVAPR